MRASSRDALLTLAAMHNYSAGPASYYDATDLTAVVHVNRSTRVSLEDLVVPRLNIAALWLLGALNAEQTRWMLCGNLLHAPPVCRIRPPSITYLKRTHEQSRSPTPLIAPAAPHRQPIALTNAYVPTLQTPA